MLLRSMTLCCCCADSKRGQSPKRAMRETAFASQQCFCKLPLGHFIRGDSGRVIELLKMQHF